MGLEGQFIFRVDELEVIEPDTNFGNVVAIIKQYYFKLNFFSESNKPIMGVPLSCAEATTFCHVHSKCTEYEEGICCKCNDHYYGNGKNCVKKGTKSQNEYTKLYKN